MNTSSTDTETKKTNLQYQLVESFRKVVVSHKTHETDTDILTVKNSRIKLVQIILSALTTCGLIATISELGPIWKTLSTFFSIAISIILLTVNSYAKNYKLEELAEKHRCAAVELWQIRESYYKLIMNSEYTKYENLNEKYENLHNTLVKIYQKSPRTTTKAYNKAKNNLENKASNNKDNLEIVYRFLPNNIKNNFK